MAAGQDLSPQETDFCRYIMDGKTQSEAYRLAWKLPENAKKSTIYSQGSIVRKRPQVQARIEQLIKAKEAGIVQSALSDRERVLSKLRLLADTATPSDSGKLRALELLGKASGLFTDRVEIDDKRKQMSSEDLTDLLKQKIAALESETIQSGVIAKSQADKDKDQRVN